MRNALFKRVFGAAALVLGLSLAGAQVAFADQFSTDAGVLDTGINASDAGNAATSGGSAVTITGAIAIVQQGNGNNGTTFPVDVPLRITSTDGSAAWATITPSSVHLTAYNVYQDFAVSVAVPAGTPSATYSFQVQGNPPQPQIGIGPGATYGFSVINPLKPPVLSLSATSPAWRQPAPTGPQ